MRYLRKVNEKKQFLIPRTDLQCTVVTEGSISWNYSGKNVIVAALLT